MNNQLSPGAVLKGQSYKYKIEKVLGQGSFGITYLATTRVKVSGALGELETTMKVAVKEFFMKDINSRDNNDSIQGMTVGGIAYNYAQKFRKEAEKLASMKHPNIVRVLDFIEANNTFYYVMEFIEGEDISHYMDGSSLSETESISIAIDVANALCYMHEQHKMLHLDLKPGNIMRRNDGHIFLIDFGLSKHYSDEGVPDTSTTIGLGTEGYAPLEQGKNSASKNAFRPTIDVYALGGTLFKMVTGETPPVASDILEDDELLPIIMTRHHISRYLQSIIISAMMPVVKKRIQSVANMRQELLHKSNHTVNENAEESIIIDDADVSVHVDTLTNPYDEDTSFAATSDYDLLSKDECVDLGLSVKWRNRNLGANTVLGAGDFRRWAEIPDSMTLQWFNIDVCISGTENDAAQTILGDGWKMPTRAQIKELIEKCDWSWVEINGVKGYRVVGRNGNSIFLPAAGKMNTDISSCDNVKGYYWCGTRSNAYKHAYYLCFDESDADLYFEPFHIQRSIRPVHD